MLDGPGMESMKLADEYGIYIGMSHHDAMYEIWCRV